MPHTTKTEHSQRLRYIRGGMWNDAILFTDDGVRVHARQCRVIKTPSPTCVEVTVYGTGATFLIDPCEIARVVR